MRNTIYFHSYVLCSGRFYRAVALSGYVEVSAGYPRLLHIADRKGNIMDNVLYVVLTSFLSFLERWDDFVVLAGFGVVFSALLFLIYIFRGVSK